MTNTHTPKLRFPEFSDQWKTAVLGDVATFSKGKGISKADISESGRTPCIRYGELYTDYGTSIDQTISYTNVSPSELHISEGNEVIIPASGEDAKDIATAAVVLRKGVALGGDLNVIRSKLDGLFLASYLSGKKRMALASMAQGHSVVHLYPTQLQTLEFAIPTLPEQKKIASFLASVDTKIGQLQRQKGLLEGYKSGCMQQLFAQVVRFNADDGSRFPDWKKMALQDAAEINPRVPELPNVFRYIDLERVSNGLLLECETIKRDEAPSRAQRYLNKNDVIFQLVRPYQKNNYHFKLDGDYVASTGYAVIRAKEAAGFLYQLLHTDDFVNKVLERCTGSNYPAINSSDLAGIEIAIPHPKEQYKIAEFLSAVDRKIELIGIEIDKAKAFKKGLLQQMFI